eukprot:TRINITY_DN1016_c0_g1_i1.p2 TRINITY_DN1016_c0_g1~~TRINITY_DN1016_c0_g1_i1.p2  ORF type:complete len:138 (-),score=4.09 TRINITY_DN1016_c0_g1_i1:362-775(-)
MRPYASGFATATKLSAERLALPTAGDRRTLMDAGSDPPVGTRMATSVATVKTFTRATADAWPPTDAESSRETGVSAPPTTPKYRCRPEVSAGSTIPEMESSKYSTRDEGDEGGSSTETFAPPRAPRREVSGARFRRG